MKNKYYLNLKRLDDLQAYIIKSIREIDFSIDFNEKILLQPGYSICKSYYNQQIGELKYKRSYFDYMLYILKILNDVVKDISEERKSKINDFKQFDMIT